EEEGLYGAHAFVKEHPWAKDVGVALNFEARGAGGPSFMFETSENNGWLIKQFIAAAPYPQANSLTYALYELLPNDTDMTEFKKAGMAGLNFAYIGDWNRYHTMLDSVQNLDRRSLQQDGSYAVAMVRQFGNLDLRWTKGTDATYFNIIGPFMARYPMRFALPLALVAAALFLVMLIIGFKRGRVRIGGMILGLISSLVTIALAFAIGTAVWWALKKIHPYYSKAPWGDPYNGTLYLAAFAGLTIAASVVIYHWCGKRANVESLASGAAICWLVVSVASAIYLPGGSFIFVWPFLFATFGLMFLLMRPAGSEGSLLSAVVLCLSAAPTVILLSPLVSSLYLLTSLNLAGGLVIVVALMLALLVPQMSLIMEAFPR
ncbi:MAG: M28 family peptidase, partial [Blastocatellia bacterium]